MDYISNKIETLITKIISLYEKHLDIDKSQISIVKYSLRLVISTIIGYLLALVCAYFLGTFSYVLTIMITISIYRSFSGGAHCSSMINCAVYGMIIINLLGLLVSKTILPNQGIILVLCFLAFLFAIWTINKYAPADTPGKPIESKVKKVKLRKRSFLIICIWYGSTIAWHFIFKEMHQIIYISAIGIIWQSFTLTPIGYKFCHIWDMALNKIFFIKGDMYA
ncbi:accessory gene regulator ArgB-like protein [Sporosalibacterium faouarense]|uniref:accessory gene regulator ArgB-like protein n=1 Tax=Sporosalibacterium faouarense TaxID=516123 RepID=UPI00192C5884|nr:accessory gene regulator B family protein [Sporosalibacterium faouarense]